MSARRPDRSQEQPCGDAPPPARELRIAPQGRSPLGKEQQTFNGLVRKVEMLRDRLVEWATFEPLHRQRMANELTPLLRQFGEARRDTILTLERILAGKVPGDVPGRAERRNLEHHLLELARAHLDEDPADAEIVVLHDRYAAVDFAADRELDRQLARDMAEQFFGVELEDHELGDSVEDVVAAGAAKARQAAEEQAEAARSRRAAGGKAGARADAKAAAAEQARQAASQSVREVFRKLASALHPDRASDEADRARRHALMQRVNHAYDEGDLLTLLTLQLETEHIDAAHLAGVSGARLGHYNRVLREQVKELEQELSAITAHYGLLPGQDPATVTPATVQHGLKRELAELKQAIKGMKAHRALVQEPAARKRWLQHYARELREDERLDGLMDALIDVPDAFLDAALDAFRDPGGGSPRGRKRGKRRRRG